MFFIFQVDTGWSAWDSWGVCNVTCGTGQQSRRRYCKNYDSAKGGAYCQGEEYDFNSCLLSSCLGDLISHYFTI